MLLLSNAAVGGPRPPPVPPPRLSLSLSFAFSKLSVLEALRALSRGMRLAIDDDDGATLPGRLFVSLDASSLGNDGDSNRRECVSALPDDADDDDGAPFAGEFIFQSIVISFCLLVSFDLASSYSRYSSL